MSIFDHLQPRCSVSILAWDSMSRVRIEFARKPDSCSLKELHQITEKPGFKFSPENTETKIEICHSTNYDSLAVAKAIAELCKRHNLSWEIREPGLKKVIQKGNSQLSPES